MSPTVISDPKLTLDFDCHHALLFADIGGPMTGTDLEIIDDAHHGDITVQTIHTSANTDQELLEAWLKSHRDGSPHTRVMYKRIGARFLDLLAQERTDLQYHASAG